MIRTTKDKRRAKEIDCIQRHPERTILNYIVFLGIAALLFLSPFFRGLFFAKNQYIALIFMTMVFWLTWFWKCFQNRAGFFRDPLDYTVFALPLVYLISTFNAANVGTAVNEVLKNTLYFMIFWSVSRFVSGKGEAVKILAVIYMTALGLSVAGLMTATGVLIHINEGFLNGRIYSSLQYPNALASYLASALFIGLYMWQIDGKLSLSKLIPIGKKNSTHSFWNYNLGPYIYTFCTFIICTALVGTKSNGGLLVLVLLLGLYFLFIKGSEKLRVLAHLLCVFFPATFSAILFLKSAINNSPGRAWLYILAGAVLAVALQYIIGRQTMAGIWDLWWRKKIILVCCSAALIIIGGLIAYQYLTTHTEIVSKVLAEIRLRNATERTYFYNDALKMVKERPITGWGGGGWQEAYRQFQGYRYDSNQVHSYYIQVLVEAGILGLLAVISIWACFLNISFRMHKGSDTYSEKLLVWTALVAALAIGSHAVIDFDLSLSALTMVLFSLFGLVYGLYVRTEASKMVGHMNRKYSGVNKSYIPIGFVSVICVIIIFVATSFLSAESSVKQAGNSLKNGDIKTAIGLYNSAIKGNPFKGDYEAAVSGLYIRQGNKDLAVAHAQTATEKAKYNSVYYGNLAEIYRLSGNCEKAVYSAEIAVKKAPFIDLNYDILARNYLYYGLDLQLNGDYEKAEELFKNTIGVEERINQQVGKLGDLEKRLWNMSSILAPTPSVKLYSGAALCLSGDYAEAENILNIAIENEKTKSEGLFWMSVLKYKQGKPEESKDYLTQASLTTQGYKEFFDKITRIR